MQFDLLERFATYSANLPPPPVPMPQDAQRAYGLDPAIYYGLGVVGVWAAIDAYAERAGKKPVVASLANSQRLADWRELDDLRNLFAHNFAGEADARYFQRARTFAPGTHTVLRSGAVFDGQRIALEADHLRYYVAQGRLILAAL
jgi:hypothetical protein